MKKIVFALLLALWLPAAPAFAQVGGSPVVYLSAASTNCTLIAAGQHTVTMIAPLNTTVTVYYLKMFDKATVPVAGTDTPIQDYPVPYGASNAGGGITLPTGGLAFRKGVGLNFGVQ